MPVFNGEREMEAAVDAILAQEFDDFELLIADNASGDGTQRLCEEYGRRDHRIRYVRHAENIGALPNFVYVLKHARGEYFMWAAVDDVRSPDYLRLNVEFLRTHPDYAASTSPMHFTGQEADAVTMGDGLLESERFEARIASFLSAWHANSGFYALFRRKVILEAMTPIAWFLGFDWVVMLRVAARGPIKRLAGGWVERGARGLSSNRSLLASSRSRTVHWILPFYDLSLTVLPLLRRARWSERRDVLLALARLNARAFRFQLGHALRLGRRPAVPRSPPGSGCNKR